jgi:integral membrane protein
MSSIKFFRIVSLAEGISLLTLLFIAMPMKYFMGLPEIVKVVGWIHGVLFMAYGVVLAVTHFRLRWPFLFSLGAMVASVIPFGAFVLDKQLRKKEVASAG